MKATTRMKALFQRETKPPILLFPATTREAKMLELLGYETFYVGAGAVIGPIVGRPDNGTITATESVQVSKWFVDAVSIPVWTDTDACFGGIFQVESAVRDLIKVGVAAITIEDQPFLGKRFGGMVGKEVVPIDEAIAKIRVASDVRDSLDVDFQIVARCDALTATNAGSLSETIDRLAAYRDAGADVLYLEGPRSLDEIASAREALVGPLTCTPFNLPHEISQDQGEALGLCAVFYLEASHLTKSFHLAVFKAILEDGYTAIEELAALLPPWAEDLGAMSNSSAMARIRAFEDRYLPERLLEKYDGNIAGAVTVSSTAARVEH